MPDDLLRWPDREVMTLAIEERNRRISEGLRLAWKRSKQEKKMQMHGATKIELDLLALLRENEAAGCSTENTNRSSALSAGIEELQRLRGSGNQTLPIDELTERFYLVRRQRDQLIAAIQKIGRWANGPEVTIECLHNIERIIDEVRRAVLGIKEQQPEPAYVFEHDVTSGRRPTLPDEVAKPIRDEVQRIFHKGKHDWCADQTCGICARRMKAQDQSEADLIASGGIVNAP